MKNKIETLLNDGYNFFQLNKFSDALIYFKKAYKLNNDYAKSLFLLGITHAELNNLEEARKLLFKAALLEPNNYYIQYNTAKVFSDLNRDKDSIQYHQKAVELSPNKYEGWLNFGLSYKKLQEYNLSLEYLKKALDINPDCYECYINLGDIFFELENYNEAINNYNLSLKINPKNSKVVTKIGVAYKHLQQIEKAIEYHKKAINIDSEDPSAYANLGIAYRGIYKMDQSIEYLDLALKLDEEFQPALINKAIAYTDLNNYEHARNLYLKVLDLNQNNTEASLNLAMLNLSNENFSEGWNYWESRWESKNFQNYINTKKKYWNGKESDCKLLIVSEQGLGDQILYASMLEDAKKLCKKVYLTCDPKLEKIFKLSFSDINIISNKNFDVSNPGNFFEYHIPIGSLGKFFRNHTDAFVSEKKAYLTDNIKITKKISKKIIKDDSIICGISWKSSNKKIGKNKSIELKDLNEVINIKKIKFVNLQYGNVTEDIKEFNKLSENKIIEHEDVDTTNDIESLASLIKNCDFVLTTSNTTAHLAGALNVPTLVMAPRGRGKLFYWTASKDSTLWYSSVKIFRQDQNFTWNKTIKAVKNYIIDKFNIVS